MIDLTIIIVSWNCKQYLAECLDSIEGSTLHCTFEIIVVDNNSTDGTLALLESRYPGVRCIANRENIGFAPANNQAIRIARSKYILLLNPDTVVTPRALDALVEFMDAHRDVWAVGPTILSSDGSPQLSGVRFPNNWDLFVEALFLDRLFPMSRIFGRHKELYEDLHKPRPVDFVQGSSLMVRKEAIELVGGLDEQFFMYFEEVDWCRRIKEAGGQVYYCPAGAIVHFAGGKLGHYDERRLVHYHRGLLLFYRKHYHFYQSMVLRLVVALRSAVRIVAWSGVAIVKPDLRGSAISSMKGYVKTLGLLFPGAV